MKILKLLEWLLWTDYVLFSGQVNQFTKVKINKFKCKVCNREFYSKKYYPVCNRLKCWWKQYK